MVVVTGDDLPAYSTNIERRRHFHPELQAELEFGIRQSTEVDADTFVENFNIFLEHDREWEDANASILESRDHASRDQFPAMDELHAVVGHEIAWQKAMWGGDYGEAYDCARDVLSDLGDSALRGYRMLWHYVAGSAAALAAREGTHDLTAQAAQQFQRAKACSPGISWLVGLARNAVVTPTRVERNRATVMLQVERLESYLLDLGVMHNRKFPAKEREIREGLAVAERFEQAQLSLGHHLGLDGGKHETDGSPDPWWCIGDLAIVFEDHVDANPATAIGVNEARQAASHPAWLSSNILKDGADCIQAVLVSPATSVRKAAIPHLGSVAFWHLDDFRSWADVALDAIREIRRDFTEPGNLDWRTRAADKLEAVRADGSGLVAWLGNLPAKRELSPVP